MDTATHLVMGVTLGSLATLDPAIAQSDIGPKQLCLLQLPAPIFLTSIQF